MNLFACISVVVAFVCQPVMEALQSSLLTAAQGVFSFLPNFAREIGARFLSGPSTAEEVPVSSALIVGAEDALLEIRNNLSADSVSVIGICGMGGIGKTTLLRKVNNGFCNSTARDMFDLVIWVTVSQEVHIPKIQKQIGDRLGLALSNGDQAAVEEQARLLFVALSKKRFLLLLDDLWASLDLVAVGIPVPKGRQNCKLVFTTRSLQVCSNMDADTSVRVSLLDDTRSWELFCSKVSTEAVLKSPAILPLAKKVVHKCGGLPLALVTVGRAMANRKLPGEWRHAVKALDRSAAELHGMEKVISVLKFSYDNLQNDKMRSALLFCAMYPEDREISREKLVEYWIGEGLLDGRDDGHEVDNHIDDARDEGDVLISDLQASCLLEAGIIDPDHAVRVHDAVRSMALWLNSQDQTCEVDGFLSFRRDNPMVGKVQGREHLIRRIWVHESDLIHPLLRTTSFPNIRTLRLQVGGFGQKIELSPLQGYFHSMTTLQVLDLSGCRWVEALPAEIGLLVELRYLNLSDTSTRSLPAELGKLVKLRQLLWEDSKARTRIRIPREAIIGLSSLQVLHMAGNDYDWNSQHSGEDDQRLRGEGGKPQFVVNDVVGGGSERPLELVHLHVLERLEELHIQLHTSQLLERLLNSDTLLSCTRRLVLQKKGGPVLRLIDDDWLYGKGGEHLRTVVSGMGGKLRQLHLCDDHVHPFEGSLQFNLDQLPCLERLTLECFKKVTKVVIVGASTTGTPELLCPSGDVETYRSFNELYIVDSDGAKELKFVGRFPHLERIALFYCGGIEKVVLDDDDNDDDADDEIGTRRGGRPDISRFPMLREMNLHRLYALKSIGRRPLLLPSLQTVFVRRCTRLRRLPLSPSSSPKLEEIIGEQEWCDALEWGSGDGSSVGRILAPFFVPLR